MPQITTLMRREVIHIGHLDSDPATLTPSRDGPGIAVCENPDAWRAITRANAPEVRLVNPLAMWVDALAFTAGCILEIQNWMITRRYMRRVPAWTVGLHDEETGAFTEKTFATRAEAAAAAGRTEAVEIEAATRGAGAAMELEGFRLSAQALRRLGRWPDPLDWYSAAILLYTREVIAAKRPLVCGVWWNETEDLPAGVAPGGVLFPEALARFEVETEDQDLLAFHDAFPGYIPIGIAPETAAT